MCKDHIRAAYLFGLSSQMVGVLAFLFCVHGRLVGVVEALQATIQVRHRRVD